MDTVHVFEEGEKWMGLYGSEDANGDIAGIGWVQYSDPVDEEDEAVDEGQSNVVPAIVDTVVETVTDIN